MEKICTKCKKLKIYADFFVDNRKKDGRYSACRKCANKATEFFRRRTHYSRKRDRKIGNLRRQKRYVKNNPSKVFSRRIYLKALKEGKIIRQPCVECGNIKSEGHHSDYSKPLKVTWLCKKHHMKIHYK